ncbi:hypothetical protein J7I83_12750 [Planococcus sp. ISL-110]|nr:hypothetical protein [Planococcus sp. ISL-110]
MKKAIGILFLIFTSLLIVGCSADSATEDNQAEAEKTADKSEQAIRAVIEKEFNGPDEKYKALWGAMAEAQTSDKYIDDYEAFLESPEYQELMSYTEETYASYFTENGYDNFINQAPAFMYSSFDGDYNLNTSTIEIAQSENETTLYDFTFQVEYTDENGDSSQFNFEGNAIAPEKGKIGEIEYSDGDELLQELRNNE